MQVWPSAFHANINRIRAQMVRSRRSQLDEKETLPVTGSARAAAPGAISQGMVWTVPESRSRGTAIDHPEATRPRRLVPFPDRDCRSGDRQARWSIRSIEPKSLAKSSSREIAMKRILAPSGAGTWPRSGYGGGPMRKTHSSVYPAGCFRLGGSTSRETVVPRPPRSETELRDEPAPATGSACSCAGPRSCGTGNGVRTP